MSGDGYAHTNGVSGSVPEPPFRDVPFEESEWAGLHAILRQVNQPKAELLRPQYETARQAYRLYIEARAEAIEAYAVQRAEDEAYNQQILALRRETTAQIQAIRERWRTRLDALREQLESARVEAYQRAGEAGINLRGGALLGIGLDDADANSFPLQEPFPPGAPQVQPSASPAATAVSQPNASTALPARVDAPEAFATPYDPPPPPIEPYSAEEAAHEARLPTAPPRVAFGWLHWLAPAVVGLLLGQLVLTAFGLGWNDWQQPLFWVALAAGALSMLAWYRALWNAARALSEMYYLFNWSAGQARRIAWLAGGAVLLVLLLPMALLLSALYLAPSLWNTPAVMLNLLALALMLPLAGLALVGGYFHGRQEVVSNAVQAGVKAAKRASDREERIRYEQERKVRTTPAPSPTPSTQGTTSAAGAPTNTANDPSPMPVPSVDPQERQRAAYVAISNLRGAYANYQNAKEAMQEELAPFQQELLQLQLRPIYPDLPPHAETRLRTLYTQWRQAYTAFLDYVAEAARDCKDGEQIAQRIAAFKEAILR
ncbi:MAG: hypothetical protein WHS44_04305 [Fimbriimonadales bacterium]|nr:MAG: hypothetical protein KatS3mg018_1670 [Fimbriimonadales bacterium]